MRDDQPLAQGGELLANWVISGERLSHWQFVAKLDSEVDPQSGLRSGTVDVGSETEAGADEVEALVGQDAETYLKGMNGEVYLISLERVVGRWTRRFPPGTIIGQGSDARHLRGGRQLEALFVRSYVWHERPPEIVVTTNGWHRIGPHDKRAPGETETPHSQTIEGLSVRIGSEAEGTWSVIFGKRGEMGTVLLRSGDPPGLVAETPAWTAELADWLEDGSPRLVVRGRRT